MRLPLVLVAAVCLFIGCGRKQETKKSVVTFEMKAFRLESESGCKGDTMACASYTIEYPVFTGLIDAVNDSLKIKMAAAVDTGNPESDTLSFEAAGRSFIEDYKSTKDEFPDGEMGWYYSAKVAVNILSDSLISLSVDNEYFTGGAHGGYGTFFINLDPSTGKSITLHDVLKPGYDETLRQIGEEEFKKSIEELNDSTSYADLGFEFPDDKFQLNDNYGFTDKGIRFVFNVYEIGPYVLGAREVFIPYDKIKNWLK
ncbi:MAG TPA: DUF3298 domain-containing protein [Cyclobacteriaceae bacterium]|nr:DUF3298 domain-containing protein [Cyclobacteriaceae bacterium]